MNRLASSTSSYLRQHAGNPVDWWPWGDDAFDEARRRDVPILLSVGYAACHWCHVMARESFSDNRTAALINANFVAVKVDREERPDVDAVYMTATQALTGQGGWPMTVFLTPDREPFYAGTYFPPTPRAGLPSFAQVLIAIAQTWTGEREQAVATAGRVTAALQGLSAATVGGEPPDAGLLADVARRLIAEFDQQHGGFRGAPKFPPTMVCEFLLRHSESAGTEPVGATALETVTRTLKQMARGGIHDQLAGGFARYSVDAHWRVPHFEKMLDDNAQLLALYSHHARLTGSDLSLRVARGIAGFLLADLRVPSGAFAASLDADAAGEEGSTYLWTVDELREVLGEKADRAAGWFGLVPGGVTLDERVLTLPADPDDPAEFDRVRSELLAARRQRPQPARDELVVLRSNGLAIAALAEAGAALSEPDWVAAAGTAADHLLSVHRTAGGWIGSSRDGIPGTAPAVLADLAGLAGGLLALYQATGDAARLRTAQELLDTAVRDFAAPDGGYYDAMDGGGLPLCPRDPTDTAAPAGLSALADALVTAAALTGSDSYRRAGELILGSVRELIGASPRAAGKHLCVAQAAVAGPVQVAITGADPAQLATVARTHLPGGGVIEVGEADAPGRPLLAGRPAVDGRPTAYVCHGFVCDLPVTSQADLISSLR